MKSVIRVLLAGVVAAFLVGVVSTPANAEDDPMHVVVKGLGTNAKAKKRLTRFHAKLLGEAGTVTLSDAFIECKNCEDLENPAKDVTELQFWIQSDRAGVSLGQFGAALTKAAARSADGDPALKLLVDFEPPPDPACPYPGPLCKARAFCASMGGCSENAFPHPCKICDGNANTSREACGIPQPEEKK